MRQLLSHLSVIERFPDGKEPQTEWVRGDEDGGQDKWPPVLRQDIANMGEVQRGMRSKGFRGNLPNPLQEVMITNFHTNLARFMAAGAPVPVD